MFCVRETAADNGIDKKIRFNHRVKRASWSTPDARWTVEAELPGGETAVLTCNFLLMCSGYYRYDEGYSPELPGVERFSGRVVHPQHWPAGLDCAGKRIVVIAAGPAFAPYLYENENCWAVTFTIIESDGASFTSGSLWNV